jgi:meso-butanediol dehydrogenase / (S,S)-butanediol dehydrogenase / diacetyl reductase
MTEARVALVTGSEGGIGGATARAFADAGYAVVGVDVAAGADLVADLATPAGARAAFETALERHGRLDAVVLAHGISGRRYGDGPVADCTDEGWDTVLAQNLSSVFYVCREAVPRLVAGGGGAIVAVGSVHGLVGGDRDFATHAYAASKAGLTGLVRAIAVHYAGDGVRANVVAPGLVKTPMSLRAQADEGIVERLPELQPLGGTFLEPDDVAAAALYLAQAERVTGAVLVVDAGWTAK